MLALRTFGAVYVSEADGSPKGGSAAQKRLLALLTVLAAAGEAAVSRDRILALLWADSDPERARHALTQTLYHARKALGCDDLFLINGGDIRLNRERLRADVDEFETKFRAGDYEGAMALYRGEFLDGFFLSGVAELEQWTSAQRLRLNELAIRACDQLAAAAETANDWTRAVDWRKRNVAIDPLSAVSTTKLMTALAAVGDRAGALTQARVYTTLVREQLDVDPDPIVVRLVEQLRSSPVEPVVAPPPAVVSSTTPSLPVAAQPPRRRTSFARKLKISVATIAATMALVAAFNAGWHGGRTTPSAATPQPVFVAPFRVTGADPSLSYLKEGMVELLSARLADDSLVHSVDPGAVLAAWRNSRFATLADVPRSGAMSVAERLGASRVVVGSVVGGQSRLVLTATLLTNPSGELRAEASVEGPADSVTVLVDRLAVKLLAANAGEAERLVPHATPPLASLRAFLNGQAAYRRGDYAAAVPEYERALAADSTFALAAMHLATASDRLNDAEQHDRALTLAWRYRRDLSERDRAYLVAFAGPRYPAPSPASEQIAAWEHAVTLAPDRADVWYELGEHYFRSGALIGATDANRRAATAFRRALTIDPEYTRARRSLILLAAQERDTAALQRIASEAALRDSIGELTQYMQWRVALARRDQYSLGRARMHINKWERESLRALIMTSLSDALAVEDGERAARISLTRATRPSDQWDALLAQHALSLNQGRPDRAREMTAELEHRFPETRAHLRLRILDALYSEGDSALAEAAVRALTRIVDAPLASTPEVQSLQLADACVVEQWRIAHHQTTNTNRAITILRGAGHLRSLVAVATPPLVCAAILEAALAVEMKHPDARMRVAAVDSLTLSGPAVSDAGTYAHILVGRLYRRLGESRLALEALHRRSYMTGWPRYLATARHEAGRLAELLGEHSIAATSFEQYLALRPQPEPRVVRQVEAVKQSLGAIESIGSGGSP